MCAQCFAQATPMVGAGLIFLRRRSLQSWVRLTFPRARRSRPEPEPDQESAAPDRHTEPTSGDEAVRAVTVPAGPSATQVDRLSTVTPSPEHQYS